LKEWLIVNFGLNLKTYIVGVHALWSSSSTKIFWHLKPIDRISHYWLEACEHRGMEVTSHKSEGEFDLGQSCEPTVVSSSHIGGNGFESRKSIHAEGGHAGSGEADGDDEEGHM
jgi:hypothetical protein